jgi:hypothetical protein
LSIIDVQRWRDKCSACSLESGRRQDIPSPTGGLFKALPRFFGLPRKK